jgi:hypothetical protein
VHVRCATGSIVLLAALSSGVLNADAPFAKYAEIVLPASLAIRHSVPSAELSSTVRRAKCLIVTRAVTKRRCECRRKRKTKYESEATRKNKSRARATLARECIT